MVLAPASCVSRENYFPSVRVGSYHLNRDDNPGEDEVIPVCEKILHGGFDGDERNGSDLALLLLQRPSFRGHVGNPMSAQDCKDGDLVALAWFSPTAASGPSEHLEAVPSVKIMPPGACGEEGSGIPDGTMCASVEGDGESATKRNICE
ncbi:unnamed protein product [Ostreobium quekettii]|uniref:Trypsin-like serine protease n=1 Tax=Ostreobium quekettii TaxID=121088 RepID=A0A8S1J0S3_9CHLO|nr:unnamed protein product [Ostreobium quekettii]